MNFNKFDSKSTSTLKKILPHDVKIYFLNLLINLKSLDAEN